MMTVVECSECGKTHGKDRFVCFPFEFSWTYDAKGCEQCGDVREHKKVYQFCCEACFGKFIKRFIGHKHRWSPRYGMRMPEKGVGYEEECKVCKLVRIKVKN